MSFFTLTTWFEGEGIKTPPLLWLEEKTGWNLHMALIWSLWVLCFQGAGEMPEVESKNRKVCPRVFPDKSEIDYLMCTKCLQQLFFLFRFSWFFTHLFTEKTSCCHVTMYSYIVDVKCPIFPSSQLLTLNLFNLLHRYQIRDRRNISSKPFWSKSSKTALLKYSNESPAFITLRMYYHQNLF